MLQTCAKCKKPFVSTDAQSQCPHCQGQGGTHLPKLDALLNETPEKSPLSIGSEPATKTEPGPPPSLASGRPAFEDHDQPFAKRFFPVVVDVMLRPGRFFSNLSKEGARKITLFAYICIFCSHFFYAAYGFALLPVVKAVTGQTAAQFEKVDFEQLEAARKDPKMAPVVDFMVTMRDFYADADKVVADLKPRLWLSLLTAPLSAFMAVHLLAGLLYLLLSWTRREKPWPYEVTYRFVVYAQAPLILGIIPVASLIASLWFLVTLSIAMRKLYGLRFFGVVFGVLLPTLLLASVWSSAISIGSERLGASWQQPKPTTPVSAAPKSAQLP